MRKNNEEKFLNEIEFRNDNLYLVLKGHLYIELELINLLEGYIPNHKILDLSKMTFNNKVKLATALNLINEESMSALLELNTIRNNYAHDLDYKVKEREIDNLKNSISKIQGLEILGEDFVLKKKEGPTVDLKVCLVGLRVLIIQQNQSINKNK